MTKTYKQFIQQMKDIRNSEEFLSAKRKWKCEYSKAYQKTDKFRISHNESMRKQRQKPKVKRYDRINQKEWRKNNPDKLKGYWTKANRKKCRKN